MGDCKRDAFIAMALRSWRDAYLGLNTSVAQAQREHGSMNQLLRQYIDLLNVLNPTAAPGWVAEGLGRGA